jgi:hypothetical protein
MNMPSNTIPDYSTLCLHLNATSTGDTVFAKNIESIISAVDVTVDNKPLSSVRDYNGLFNTLQSLTFSQDINSKRTVLQNGAAVSAVPAAASGGQTGEFAISSWLGFLGSCQPSMFDTRLVGTVQVRITLAGPEALVLPAVPSTTSQPGFTLTNVYYTIDCISINDGIYRESIDKWLADGQVFAISYKSFNFWPATSSSYNITGNFNISTHSLDRIIAWITDSAATNQLVPATGTNGYFTHTGGNLIVDWQFNIGGPTYPNFRVPNGGATFVQLQKALGHLQDMVGGIDFVMSNANPPTNVPSTLTKFQTNFWTCAVQLDHGSDPDRFRSGLNTAGNSQGAYFSTTSAAGTAPVGSALAHIHCETTCIMYIGMNKQVVVEY